MTAALPEAQVTRLREQASEVRFGLVLVTVITSVFYAIGWLAGHAWTGLVLCALAIRLGFREGSGRVPAEAPEGARGG